MKVAFKKNMKTVPESFCISDERKEELKDLVAKTMVEIVRGRDSGDKSTFLKKLVEKCDTAEEAIVTAFMFGTAVMVLEGSDRSSVVTTLLKLMGQS